MLVFSLTVEGKEDEHPGPHHLGPYSLGLGICIVYL